MKLDVMYPLALVLIPIVILGIILSAKGLRMGETRKKIEYCILRGIICLGLILALAGLRIKWSSDITTTVFLVDVSDSVEGRTKEIEEYLRNTIKDMPKKNKVAVIAFGGNSVVEQFVTDKKLFDELQGTPLTTATNLEKACSAAMGIFPDDTAKRLVLLTDGIETEGSIGTMQSSFAVSGIELDVIRLTQDTCPEVYVSDLSIPDRIHLGDTFPVTVTIKSNCKTKAMVSLYAGRTLKGQQEVQVEVGENQYVFQDVGDNGGLKSYRVTIESPDDNVSVNNEYSAFTQVEAQPKVLLIEGTAGEGEAFAGLLEAAGINFDRVTPSGVPNNMADLVNYKCVISLDVYYDDFKKEFLSILDSYVKDYAGGFICIGGEDSYAVGGYKDTELEKILPVYMDLVGEKEIPKMAVVMVIDHSGSMSTASADNTNVTGLDLAKQAAIEGLDSLRPTDEIGVLAFDDAYTWTVPIQEADNLKEITNQIATIGYGGGTSIFPAVKEATKKLKESDAKIKHIILLTDGQDTYHEFDSAVQDIVDNGITLSSVAVGGEADTKLMEDLATQCNGRYYFTDINNGIPRIFAKEVFLSVRSYLVEHEFTPVIVNAHEVLEGVAEQGMPSLLGYVASTPKPTCIRILESDQGDPILSTWQYGLGRTIAWNSDGTNEWTGNWAGWDKNPTFWKNLIQYTVSDTSLGEDTLEVVQKGAGAVIRYATDDYNSDTKIQAVYTKENGEQDTIELDPVAPGQYEAEIPLHEIGVYSISLQNKQGDTVKKSVNSAVAMQYSPEYRFDITSNALDSFLEQVGGKEITMEDEVFAAPVETVKAQQSLTGILLAITLVLFLYDVIMRRMNLSLFGGLGRRKKKEKPDGDVKEPKEQQEQSKSKEQSKKEPSEKTRKRTERNKEKTKKQPEKPKKTGVKNRKQQQEEKNKQAQENMNELLKRKQDRQL